MAPNAMTELVSVIIPTFNRAHLLPRALVSVQAQTFPNIELIVIDDGSTDDTSNVVKKFSNGLNFPVIYRRQENRGCAAARNAGIFTAKGDFIYFFDSDDALLPTAIEHLVAALRGERTDFVYSPAIEVPESGTEWVNLPVAAGQPDVFAIEHFLNSNVRAGAILYTREIIRVAGGLDEDLRHNEDSDFVQRVAMVGKPSYCGHPTIRVYHHAGSKSRDRVAIYQALLHSSERTLANNPDFLAKLGPRGCARLNLIRGQLVDALIAQRHFAKAKELIRFSGVKVSPTVRLSLFLNSRFPISIRNLTNRLMRRVSVNLTCLQ